MSDVCAGSGAIISCLSLSLSLVGISLSAQEQANGTRGRAGVPEKQGEKVVESKGESKGQEERRDGRFEDGFFWATWNKGRRSLLFHPNDANEPPSRRHARGVWEWGRVVDLDLHPHTPPFPIRLHACIPRTARLHLATLYSATACPSKPALLLSQRRGDSAGSLCCTQTLLFIVNIVVFVRRQGPASKASLRGGGANSASQFACCSQSSWHIIRMGFLLSGAEVGLDTHANDVGIRVENGESKIWVDMASVVVQLFTAHEPTHHRG